MMTWTAGEGRRMVSTPLRHVTSADVFLVALTRGILGVGIGLLVAGRLSNERRRTVGRTLAALGAATTVPLVWRLFRNNRPRPAHQDPYFYDWAE